MSEYGTLDGAETTENTGEQSRDTEAQSWERSFHENKNLFAFAALKENGSVVTWGRSTYGGDSSEISSDLQSGVVEIFSSGYAFAALKSDGSVITWGLEGAGGDSKTVRHELDWDTYELTSIELDDAYNDLRSGVTDLFHRLGLRSYQRGRISRHMG